MAQGNTSRVTPEVVQFTELVMGLILKAGEYASAGVRDEDTERAIRQVRTMTAALNAALQATTMVPPTLIAPPIEPSRVR